MGQKEVRTKFEVVLAKNEKAEIKDLSLNEKIHHKSKFLRFMVDFFMINSKVVSLWVIFFKLTAIKANPNSFFTFSVLLTKNVRMQN